MKRLLAILLSLCCLFLIGCESAASAGNENQSESSSQIENSEQPTNSNNSSNDNITSTENAEEKPTTRNATNQDLVFISFSQTENNCIAKFLVTEEIKDCVLRFYLCIGTHCYWSQSYFFDSLEKNKIQEFKFAYYEKETTKDIIFEKLMIVLSKGTVELE